MCLQFRQRGPMVNFAPKIMLLSVLALVSAGCSSGKGPSSSPTGASGSGTGETKTPSDTGNEPAPNPQNDANHPRGSAPQDPLKDGSNSQPPQLNSTALFNDFLGVKYESRCAYTGNKSYVNY